MRFGSTDDERKAKKRTKYLSKPTDVIWFAWRPVRFDNDKWAFWERVRCTREILNDYGEKWSVKRWKYHPIDIPNDEDLHDHLRTSQEPDNRDG